MAAQEFRSRLRRDLNLDDDDMAWMRTLHSLAWRLLGMDRLRLANTHFKEFEQTYPQFPMSDRKTARVNEDLFEPLDEQESDGRKGDVLLGIWTYVRNRNGHDVMEAASRGQFPSNVDYTPFEVSTFVGVYEAWKQENNFLDFTDLLMRVLTERIAPPTQMFLLDEAQDMTPLQWAVWDRWVAGADYVGLFGDDDQTLYEFMGARPQEFLERAGRGTHEVLARSYRCPSRIVEVARSVIERNRDRQPKEYHADRAGGRFGISLDVFSAVAADATVPTFVLARHRYQLEAIAKELMARGVPFDNRRGIRPLATKAAKAAVTAAMLAVGNAISWRDWLALVECLPSTGEIPLMEHGAKGGKQYAQARAEAERRNQLGLWDLVSLGVTPAFYGLFGEGWESVLRMHVSHSQRTYFRNVFERHDLEGLIQQPAITLSTVHGVKGEERTRVVLLTDISARAWRDYTLNPEGERRVLYVGLTRARDSVQVIAPQTNRCWQEIGGMR
jgi:DNA helicase-2/ATP-dependent DNA helicase PcrA